MTKEERRRKECALQKYSREIEAFFVQQMGADDGTDLDQDGGVCVGARPQWGSGGTDLDLDGRWRRHGVAPDGAAVRLKQGKRRCSRGGEAELPQLREEVAPDRSGPAAPWPQMPPSKLRRRAVAAWRKRARWKKIAWMGCRRCGRRGMGGAAIGRHSREQEDRTSPRKAGTIVSTGKGRRVKMGEKVAVHLRN
ncbi:hypothetical protein EJB05_24542, partial [Eragrostis curvula]